MNKEDLIYVVEDCLKKFEKMQINLESEQARRTISEEISETIVAKFYFVPFLNPRKREFK